MSIDPDERVTLGRTAVSVTRLGFGAAPIGGLYEPFPEADGVATVRRAWDMGIRYFDVAPLYGYGNAERRLGLGLAAPPAMSRNSNVSASTGTVCTSTVPSMRAALSDGRRSSRENERNNGVSASPTIQDWGRTERSQTWWCESMRMGGVNAPRGRLSTAPVTVGRGWSPG